MGEKETMPGVDTAARSGTLNVSASPGGSANLADDGSETDAAARSVDLTVHGNPTGLAAKEALLNSRPTADVTIPLARE